MKIEMIGKDNSKLSYVVIDRNSTSYASDTPKQYNPPITDDTLFAVLFNNKLMAVNTDIGSAPSRLTLYRFDVNDSVQFPLATIELGEIDIPRALVDFSAANGEEYRYVMYPEDVDHVYTGVLGSREDTGEDYISGFVGCEELITAHWNDGYNAYIADKVFYFDANNQAQSINNNAVVQKNQTFGRFFNIQHGATNVFSGQLSSMLGYFDCNTGEYVSSFEIEDAIRWLTTDQSTKFYKSARGYVLPVDITSTITFTHDNSRRTSTVSLEWTERDIPHTPTVIGVIS